MKPYHVLSYFNIWIILIEKKGIHLNSMLLNKPVVKPLLSCLQDHLLKEGLAWLDSQAAGEAQYWLPALFSELTSRDVTPEEANQMTP